LIVSLFAFSTVTANEAKTSIPTEMLKIMQQDKYAHSNWGLFAKNISTGKVLLDHNSNQMFLPASTTKLFSMAALLNAYGDDYRFKTPVYATGDIQNNILEGNLILVGQGDLTMGGRQDQSHSIAYTKLDHSTANEVPGALLTKQDPLYGFRSLAKQVFDKGIKEINGDILIDDRLFETTEKRGTVISPLMVNENLIDIVINPQEVGKEASLTWRPMVEGYTVKNEVTTTAKETPVNIEITSDESGKNILVKGSIPTNQNDLLRVFLIKNPKDFARAAFITTLKSQGIKINHKQNNYELPNTYNNDAIASWTSPPLSEYVKLILKVSHNTGANLVPLLLAAKNGQKTFAEGMLLLGNFVTEKAKISGNAFVFIDGAGGDENRLTPQAEIQLLEYMQKKPPEEFERYLSALPILGFDGSLADFGKNTNAVGKVFAKTGTGASFNLATNKFFLTTQALAGYIKTKNGDLIAFMIAVNNASMPKIEDVFAIFEDQAQMAALILQAIVNDSWHLKQETKAQRKI
jgi:D-alanyl-D-alanine carboxypeptidase/D-alanyl-D-alanine-endopeptidase (penicillin-binding protein 4)